MGSKATISAMTIGLSLAFGGVGFAQANSSTTTTEKPAGQKTTSTHNPSPGQSSDSTTAQRSGGTKTTSTHNPSFGQSSNSTTTQHGDGTKTTSTTSTSKTERSDYK
jgi:hypothetical protein